MNILQSSDSDSFFKVLCRNNNWKCTPQRRVIFSFLTGNCTHPTAETIWTEAKKQLPSISRDSVYRILDDFSAVGVVRRLESGRAVRYDPDSRPHDHFVCTRCGTLFDFDHLAVEPVVQAAERFGVVEAVDLTVRGICRKCLQ